MEKMFDVLLDPVFQQGFLESKRQKIRDAKQFQAMKEYITGETLARDAERLRGGDWFLKLPHLKEVAKDATGEKRALYIFSGTDQFLLGLMGYALKHLYDHLFTDGLYSFRVNKSNYTMVEDIHHQISDRDKPPYFAFKTDMKSYSTNIDQDILIRKLSGIFAHDPEFMAFLEWLIRRNQYMHHGQVVDKYLSALPGCPLTGFFTNVYLMDIDEYFQTHCDFYCRYTDDVLVLCREDHKVFTLLIKLRDMARENKLELKSVKTQLFSPNEPINIVGMRFEGSELGISKESLEKIKCKGKIAAKKAVQEIRRTGISHEEAARRFLQKTLRPFIHKADHNETNYAMRYFPFITSDDDLREIDHWIQHCARFVLTEKWGKAQYRASYSKLKSLGYVSLVHLYHNGCKDV